MKPLTSIKRLTRSALLTFAGLLFAANVAVADTPLEYDTNYFEGVIGWVDVSKRALVVDDTAFVLSDAAARSGNLRQGVKVRLRYRLLNGQLVVLQITP